MTSRLCRAIKSNNWFTRKDGGSAWTPPRGMVMRSRHIGHRNCPVSRANVATILSKHWIQTVCEHGISFGLCSPPSYMPLIEIFLELMINVIFWTSIKYIRIIKLGYHFDGKFTYIDMYHMLEMTHWSLRSQLILFLLMSNSYSSLLYDIQLWK